MWWFLLILLVGCAEIEEPVVAQEHTYDTYQDLFVYAGVSSYTYLAGIEDLELTVATTVEPTEYGGGISAFALENTILFEDQSYSSTMYISRTSHACLELVDDECPVVGLNSNRVRGLLLEDLGMEWVTVPAGQFDTHKYIADGITYWVVPSIPVPVKYAGEGFVFVLSDWE